MPHTSDSIVRRVESMSSIKAGDAAVPSAVMNDAVQEALFATVHALVSRVRTAQRTTARRRFEVSMTKDEATGILVPANEYRTLVENERFVFNATDSAVRGYRRTTELSLGYGEVTERFVEWFAHVLVIDETSRVVDIGSGLGRFVLGLAALTGADTVGIELDSRLDALARNNSTVLMELLRARNYTYGRASFFAGDAMSEETWRPIDRRLTHVFVNNFLIDDRTVEAFIFAALAHSTSTDMVLVLIRPLTLSRIYDVGTLASHVVSVEHHNLPPDSFSWTASQLHAFVYRLSRQPIERTPDHYRDFRRAYNRLLQQNPRYGERPI